MWMSRRQKWIRFSGSEPQVAHLTVDQIGLAFVENNFGLTMGSIGGVSYPFADKWAPEFGAGQGVVPLADFFPISPTVPRVFSEIPIDPLRGQSYFRITSLGD